MKRIHSILVSNDDGASDGRPPPHERSKMACDQCRRRKLRCNDIRPCEACNAKDLFCTVSTSRKGPGRPRNPDRISLSGDHATSVVSEPPPFPVIAANPPPTYNAHTVPSTIAAPLDATDAPLSIIETLDTVSSEITPASHPHAQTLSDGQVFPLSAFGTSLSSAFASTFNEPTQDWNNGDIDFMDGDYMDEFWELSSSVSG